MNRKNIFAVILLTCLSIGSLYAQLPTSRSVDTKIADVLAQQPADEFQKFQFAMSELETFSAPDFAQLLTRLKKPGENNAPIEYVTNSYAFYVSQKGKEGLKATFINGLIEALGQVKEQEGKGFVLELMYRSADASMVDKASAFLLDPYLGDKAANLLGAIGTVEALRKLESALQNATDEPTTNHLVTAIGETHLDEAENAILAVAEKYNSPAYKRNILTALSKVGGSASYTIFQNSIQAANFSYEPSSATGLTMIYIDRLYKNGQESKAKEFANYIYKNADNTMGISAKAAALQFLAKDNTSIWKKELLKASTGSQPILRDVAFQTVKSQLTEKDLLNLIKQLPKLNEGTQLDILGLLAGKQDPKLITALSKVAPKLSTPEAKTAAYQVLLSSSNGQYWPQVIKQIPQADEKETRSIQNLLLTSKDIPNWNTVTGNLSDLDSKTQQVLLQVLSSRRFANTAPEVLGLLNSSDPKVKEAAFKALPNVTSANELNQLFDILENANNQETVYVQRAITNIINNAASETTHQQVLLQKANQSAAKSKYFPILAVDGSDEALALVLKDATKQGNNNSSAISTLAKWSSENAIAPLLHILRSQPLEEGTRNEAYIGIIRNIRNSTIEPEQKTLYLFDLFDIAQKKEHKNAVISALGSTGTYQALAFAASYLQDVDYKGAATHVVMNIALDNADFYGSDVREWLKQASDNLSGSESSYLREAIVRHLAEMPDREGYVPLFNGKDLTGWKGLVENPIKRAQMTAAELSQKQAEADQKMKASWVVENGLLTFMGKGDNIATVKEYGDFELLVDWRLDKDGKEPDAGIYLRGAPQVQIWDISRTDVGAQVGSGGLYNNSTHRSTPLKVADNPLGEWNTFKVKMVDEHVWVWLNGELVVDSVVLENYWDRNQSIFPTEQIELQAHGSKVWYRNIFLKEIPRKEIYRLSNDEKNEGFTMLFDGNDLDKWIPSPAYEITEEGFIRSNPDAKFGKNLYTKDEYADFVYRFEFKLTPGANNGVGIRTPIEGDAAYVGMEIQVLDDTAEIYSKLEAHQYHGSVYGIIPAKRGSLRPVGEWNEQEIHIKGNKIRITVNGQVIVDGDLQEASKDGTLDKKNHPGLLNKSGHIGFLGHGSEVFFRNIRIKEL